MIRKFAIAAAAIVALGTASLSASTPAAAGGKGGGFHHHHYHGGGFGLYSGVGLYGYDSCYRTRWVMNRYGNMVRRVINICG
ncbi:MAG: hypothetical protein WCG92_21100 [Hyphomicrobiales bacterium]|nr:hypothetical protein [Alphaproteobacteria bacterium]